MHAKADLRASNARVRVRLEARTRGPGPKRAPVRTTGANAQLATRIAAWRLARRNEVGWPGKWGWCSVVIGGAMHGRTRARNCPVERPTHATVWASGVVCANACSPAQCHGWHADWWCPGRPPATALGTEGHADRLVAAAKGRPRCEGETRELTQRACVRSQKPVRRVAKTCWG